MLKSQCVEWHDFGLEAIFLKFGLVFQLPQFPTSSLMVGFTCCDVLEQLKMRFGKLAEVTTAVLFGE
jgi:hypothetical protein